jgi:hypothetical protein
MSIGNLAMIIPPYPHWVLDTPPGIARDIAEHRFLVLLVELYTGPTRSLRRVAELLDINESSLRSRISDSRGSALMVEDRETLLQCYCLYSGERL